MNYSRKYLVSGNYFHEKHLKKIKPDFKKDYVTDRCEKCGYYVVLEVRRGWSKFHHENLLKIIEAHNRKCGNKVAEINDFTKQNFWWFW